GGPIEPEHRGAQLIEQFLAYKSALKDSHQRHDDGTDHFVPGEPIRKGARQPKAQLEARLEPLARLARSLPADQLAAMDAELASLREGVAKDWNQAYPET